MNTQNTIEIRCGECGRLLAKGEAAEITIKCPRCGTMNHITMSGQTAKPRRPGASQGGFHA